VLSESHRHCAQAASEVAGTPRHGSLARLWQQQGKRKHAHKMLSEIYTWFTEGFDTKDLQEAKALLEDLGKWRNG
jgi:predicted ATPase